MKRINNEHYISRMDENAPNRRGGGVNRSRQEKILVKLKQDIEYNNKRELEDDISHKMEDLSLRRKDDLNRPTREMPKIGNSNEQALKSKMLDYEHQIKMNEINNCYKLRLEEFKSQDKKVDNDLQEDLQANKIKNEDKIINNNHEENMARIKEQINNQNNQYRFRCMLLASDLNITNNMFDNM